jgi:hypothetical protein
MHKLTNKDAWLQLFATNDNALIAAITLCQRFAPTDPTLTDAQAEYIAEKKQWLYQDANDEFVAIVDEKVDTITVQQYNNEIYPALNKADCFLANLDHALQKSDENARMQCRVVGWDDETKKLLRTLIEKYREDVKKKIR